MVLFSMTSFLVENIKYFLLNQYDIVCPQLEVDKKIHIAIQICQALTFMHTNTPPMAHLDIKPSNILVRMDIIM